MTRTLQPQSFRLQPQARGVPAIFHIGNPRASIIDFNLPNIQVIDHSIQGEQIFNNGLASNLNVGPHPPVLCASKGEGGILTITSVLVHIYLKKIVVS